MTSPPRGARDEMWSPRHLVRFVSEALVEFRRWICPKRADKPHCESSLSSFCLQRLRPLGHSARARRASHLGSRLGVTAGGEPVIGRGVWGLVSDGAPRWVRRCG
jgi:hypothetical protein